MTRLPEAAFARLTAILPEKPSAVVAVSGGGDSIAMLHLAHRWGVRLHAVTVDHGLREGSRAEAEGVAKVCADLGVPHKILTWQGWDGTGNLQDAARQARRSLIEEAAKSAGIAHVLTGHTADDQAETVLLRLSRGSGVDGLAAMPETARHGVFWHRPLLGIPRAELRAWLRAEGISWIEDPSNDDTRFDRIRARKMLQELSDLGLTADRLTETAGHMRAAQEVLDAAMCDLASRSTQIEGGDIVLDPAQFRAAPDDTRHRLLSSALSWVSGAPYRPRFDALKRLADSLNGTLHGCHLYPSAGRIRITREFAAVKGATARPDELWDTRWYIDGPDPDATVAPLGEEGLNQWPAHAKRTLPAKSAISTPAIWKTHRLIAAPVAGFSADWHAKLAKGRDIFPSWRGVD